MYWEGKRRKTEAKRRAIVRRKDIFLHLPWCISPTEHLSIAKHTREGCTLRVSISRERRRYHFTASIKSILASERSHAYVTYTDETCTGYAKEPLYGEGQKRRIGTRDWYTGRFLEFRNKNEKEQLPARDTCTSFPKKGEKKKNEKWKFLVEIKRSSSYNNNVCSISCFILLNIRSILLNIV